MTEPKFKVGNKWRRKDGKIVEIQIIDERLPYPLQAGNDLYQINGSYNMQWGSTLDLIEKVECKASDYTIINFQAKVFEFENNPNIASDDPIQFPLADLAVIARQLYAYEKFVSELQESLKDGDDKRRMLAEKIEML